MDIQDTVMTPEYITPLILNQSKEIITENQNRKDIRINSPINEASYKQEALSIFTSEKSVWNDHLDKREECFYKHSRCHSLLNLYTEGLEEEPLYIPRKFRNDNMFTKSKEEEHVVEKLNLQRLQAEMEVLRIRKDNYQ